MRNYDVVIIDKLHSNLFEILLKKKKTLIVPIRDSIPIILSVNFFFKLFFYILKYRLNYKKIKKNYLSFLFKLIKTKRVFTFYENTSRIETLKKSFPNINFYTFINGTRIPNYIYKHDNLVSWGKINYEMDNNNLSIKSNNYFNLGSLRLLNYKTKKKRKIKKKIDLIYISSFQILKNGNKNINSIYKFIRRNENILMHNLSFVKNNKNINFKILMKNKINDQDFFEELSYLKKYFSKKQIIIKKNDMDSYEYIESSKITISLVSALGFEALSLNTKVLLGFPFFNINHNIKSWPSLKYYCKYLKPEISLKSLNKKYLLHKINVLKKMNRKNYIKKTANCRKYYSENPNLKKFIKKIYEN